MSQNAETARRFLASLAARDTTPLAELLAEDVVEVLPLAASGDTGPAAVFEGREAVLHVQDVIVDAFSEVAFVDPQVTESADGQTVFVEALGRRVQKDSGRRYENVYVLKFEFRDGLIRRITEYSNPVAFAKFFDRPVG